MKTYNLIYDDYLNEIETAIKRFADGLDCKPDILRESLLYSLQAGGKRLRPVLMLAVADVLSVPHDKVINFALALELIHTYSLIHDDLPEMDNDDYRRGRLSNHKVYGCGNAVLAGDGLLNTAYSILFDMCAQGKEQIAAAKFICNCAGIYGMIAGQSADLLHENDKDFNSETLEFIYKNKTSKLITAAVVTPSIICGGKNYSELKSFGYNLGYLFQLTDDILDVEGNFEQMGKSIGKDKDEGKYTSIAVYGLEESKLQADLLTSACSKILEGLDGDVGFLKELVETVKTRIN